MNEDTLDISFPLKGVDTSTEYGEPRTGTTANAVNVRAFDPLLQRFRGGSRHGLLRYPDDQLAVGGSKVEQFTSAGKAQWTAPSYLSGTVIIECWGAGGHPDNNSGGATDGVGGGGGGEYARLDAFAAVAGDIYDYVIGSGDIGAGVDGEATTFGVTLCVANGGKADGTGGAGGTGDFTGDGGAGGVSGTGLGGGGGGSSGYFFGVGNFGNDGSSANTGGGGGSGFPTTDPTPQGAGGNGATGDPGNEVDATVGEQPGGGGGGAACDTGGNPTTLLSSKAGDGMVKITYNLSTPIQHLNQLVIYTYDNLVTSFEYYNPDFIPDPSTNNGSTRNPGRDVPPGGSGVQPNRNRPASPRRRIQVIAAPTTATNGSTATLTSTLTDLPGSTPIGSQTVTLYANPRTSDGYGDVGTTNGSGVAVFTVNEPTYEGVVTYTTVNQYTDGVTGKRVTAAGTAQIRWQPNYTVEVTSELGYIFDVGLTTTPGLEPYFRGGNKLEFPVSIRLIGAGGSGVANRRLLVESFNYAIDGVTPAGPINDFISRVVTTDANGNANFTLLWGLARSGYTQQVNARLLPAGANRQINVAGGFYCQFIQTIRNPDPPFNILTYTRTPPPDPGPY